MQDYFFKLFDFILFIISRILKSLIVLHLISSDGGESFFFFFIIDWTEDDNYIDQRLVFQSLGGLIKFSKKSTGYWSTFLNDILS